MTAQQLAFDIADTVGVDALTVAPIPAQLARDLAARHHYMHRKPQVSYAYGLIAGLDVVGICVFGVPASRHVQLSACPAAPGRVIELNRLWVDDRMPRNTESWFVARALRMLPPRIVVSYADTAHGHIGYIYRALSFRYAGWTDMERRTPRLDYIPADPNTHTRDAFRNGYVAKVRRKPKVKYWTTTGTRADRRHLARMCAWPRYDWRTLPPPNPEETP